MEIDDPAWEDLADDTDVEPYCGRPYLRALADIGTVRPILIALENPAWSLRYVLLLTPCDSGWLARTPDYGGPWIRARPGTTVAAAAAHARSALDKVVIDLGVVSEVFLLSPWCPHAGDVARAWDTAPTKSIWIARLHREGDPAISLAKGRRSDILRARRELEVGWRRLDTEGAADFAIRYANAMTRLAAEPRWCFTPTYFAALANAAASQVFLSIAASETGGAAALFLTGRRSGAYFLACRWGDAHGATSLVLSTAMQQLGAQGFGTLTLGGGATDRPDDTLLAFKRSFADVEHSLQVGARVFRPHSHSEAVRAGLARPLPAHAVAPALS